MTTQKQVLVSGGSSGIGLGLARRYAEDGAQVVITGRSADRLAAVERDHPGIRGVVSDLGERTARESLASQVSTLLPALDTLVNNAGIQRRVGLADDDADWDERQAEIDILLAGPVHLTSLLVPGMVAGGRPAVIVDVTSGGALVPQPFAPVYSACKAAVRSWTTTLRLALADTGVRVVELLPPAVATGLGGEAHGADLDRFCDEVFPQLDGSVDEVGFGATAEGLLRELRESQRRAFDAVHAGSQVARYRP